jgi:shikimate 5-dehydrogenase/3-dehydroquinate dehydratase
MIVLTIPFRDNSCFLPSKPQGTGKIEYRLDYCTDPSVIDFTRFHADDILTFRDASEGGHDVLTDCSKAALIKEIIEKNSSILDCEYLFLKRNPGLLIPSERLLLSLHTDCTKMDLINAFLGNSINALYYKLAVSCRSLAEFDEIVRIIPDDKQGRMFLVPLFPAPMTLRLVYKLYGSAAAYAYWHEPVVKHQPSLSLAAICRIDRMDRDTEIFGILGGEQVVSSLSVMVYNRWFELQKQNKVLIPVIATSQLEADDAINWLQEKAKIRGFAITMPLKRKLARHMKSSLSIANSWLPAENNFANTDETAFKLALRELGITPENSVLILGTGATAETAMHVLEKNRIRDITLWNRHKIVQTHHDSASRNQAGDIRYDLLINCTPFGFNVTDKADSLPEFRALIDLPYGKTASILVREAESQGIPCIDGFSFWKWQAIAQAEFFGLEAGFADFVRGLDLTSLLQ